MTKPARMVGVAVVAALVVAIPAFARSHGSSVSDAKRVTPGYCVSIGATGATASPLGTDGRGRRIECICGLGAKGATGAKRTTTAAWCRPHPCPLRAASAIWRCGPPIWCVGPVANHGRLMPGVIAVCPCRSWLTGATGVTPRCPPVRCFGEGATGAKGATGSVMCVPPRCPLPLASGAARAAGVAILCLPCPGATGAKGATGSTGTITCIPPCLWLSTTGTTGVTGSTGARGCVPPPCPYAAAAAMPWCGPVPCTGPTGVSTASGATVWCGPRPPCGPPLQTRVGNVRNGPTVVCPLATRRAVAIVGS